MVVIRGNTCNALFSWLGASPTKSQAAPPTTHAEPSTGSVYFHERKWHFGTVAALTGAALFLAACGSQGSRAPDNLARAATTTEAATPARPGAAAFAAAMSDPNLLVIGAAATRAPQYPSGPKFYALPAEEAELEIDFAVRQLPRQERVPVLGVLKGRDFTTTELADLYAVLDAVRPLWRCPNTPLKSFARMDRLFENGVIKSEVYGTTLMSEDGPVALADSAHQYGFRKVVSHEIIHKLLQNADPSTCTNYNDPYENPLVQKWMERMGWKDKKTLTSPLIPGTTRKEQPPGTYAYKSPLEDMADSFTWYLEYRDALRATSPSRVAFFDELFRQLGVAPPRPLASPITSCELQQNRTAPCT